MGSESRTADNRPRVRLREEFEDVAAELRAEMRGTPQFAAALEFARLYGTLGLEEVARVYSREILDRHFPGRRDV